MSETPATYTTGTELEQALNELQEQLQAITANPDTSIWLRKAITELWSRDSIEALEDLETLQTLMEARKKADLLMLDRWAETATKH